MGQADEDTDQNSPAQPTFILFVDLSDGIGLTQHGPLDDPTSFAAQVARRRGRGTLVFQNDDGEFIVDPDAEDIPEDPIAVGELFDPNRSEYLNPKTGLGMVFVSPEMKDCTPADLAATLPVYPCPEAAYESLPAHIQGVLGDTTFTKVRCSEYDSEDQTLVDPELDWDIGTVDPIKRMLSIAEETNTREKAMDYVTFLYGPAELQDVEAIADKRGIEPESVAANIRDVAEELGESDGLPDSF